MPLISVIIPVYNGAKTIAETIDSVLAQSFLDFEIVTINDGSQDKTLEVLTKFTDDRLKVFSYANAGVAVSRNRGITHASGELIAFLDADDLWRSDKLELQFNALQETPQADVAYSWTDYIDDKSQFLYPGSHITANGNVYPNLLIKNFIENGSNPLIRRRALMTVGEFDPTLPPAEDWDMWLRLAAKYEFVAVPVAQVFYRVTATSLSTNLRYQEQVCLQVIEKALGQDPDLLRSLKQPSLTNLYQYLMFRSLVGELTRPKSLEAARYFRKALLHDPLLWQKRPRLMAIVSLKIASGILLPIWMIQVLQRKLKATRSSQ